MDNSTDGEFLYISSEVLPEVFNKVVAVKKLLQLDPKLSVNRAVKTLGLSRSAYYKYRNFVLTSEEKAANSACFLLFAERPYQLSELCLLCEKTGIKLASLEVLQETMNSSQIFLLLQSKNLIELLSAFLDDLKKFPWCRDVMRLPSGFDAI